jgi:hypothetical protein
MAAVRAVVATVASVRAVVAVVEDEVVASPLRQPVDPEGENLHAWVRVHFMMRLDVEGRANILNFLKVLLGRSMANLVSLKNGSSSA